MIYRLDKNNYNNKFCKIKLSFDRDIIHEANAHLKYKKYYNDVTINIFYNSIRDKHGPRIKVVDVPGHSGQSYEYPINLDTGVVTYVKKYNPDEKVGEKLVKLIAGYTRANLDILKKYSGYVDNNRHIIDGDKNMEYYLRKAAEEFNKLPRKEKDEYIDKGVIKYGKN